MIVIRGVSTMIAAKQEMLAVGDSAGTLHILDVPWALKNPSTNEVYIYNNILVPSHSVSMVWCWPLGLVQFFWHCCWVLRV